jgi:general secretion pathway protein G
MILLLLVILWMIFVLIFQSLLDPGAGRRWKLAKVKITKMQMGAFGQALDMFKSDNGDYPAGTNGLNDLAAKPVGTLTNWHQCLDTIPPDPWGHPYLYEYPGKHRTNSYDLSSAGPDGKYGTADDIVNW